MGELLTLALELKNVVARAAALRADLPLLFRDERLGEIEALLQGPSIPLPANGPVPLARRDLPAALDGAEAELSQWEHLAGPPGPPAPALAAARH